MSLSDSEINWAHWYERWEAMQACYVVQREHRFDLMLQVPDLPPAAVLRILDLGCGPGSLAFRALRHYPNAHVLAVDADPVLLAMGRGMALQRSARVQFLQADIRQGDWWPGYDAAFDLVVSATALHWLGVENLRAVYRRIYHALRPGGWFMNSDHVASDDPGTQERNRQMLASKQKVAFHATAADDWDGFWQALGEALSPLDLRALWAELNVWEGTDDGQPKQFHLDALRQCGFERVDIYWQELGEAVIGACKLHSCPK